MSKSKRITNIYLAQRVNLVPVMQAGLKNRCVSLEALVGALTVRTRVLRNQRGQGSMCHWYSRVAEINTCNWCREFTPKSKMNDGKCCQFCVTQMEEEMKAELYAAKDGWSSDWCSEM